ncbi:unnamed protein product [Heterobilharzia americana]|nr:unnamed protein product [Heterobilharzia americana]
MLQYMNNLGVVEGLWKFVDVFSLDDDMLAFIPEPVISLLFLYPLETPIENASLGVEDNSSKVILIKQTVGNACGTIAILNAIANNRQNLSIKDGSFLSNSLDRFEDMTPAERGAVVETKKDLSVLHEKSALEGQTNVCTYRGIKNKLAFCVFCRTWGLFVRTRWSKKCTYTSWINYISWFSTRCM